jgi:hypothetical protein
MQEAGAMAAVNGGSFTQLLLQAVRPRGYDPANRPVFEAVEGPGTGNDYVVICGLEPSGVRCQLTSPMEQDAAKALLGVINRRAALPILKRKEAGECNTK